MKLPILLEQSVDKLVKLPGVGRKTALRYALFLAQLRKDQIQDFIDRIGQLQNLNKCRDCNALADNEICDICSDDKRKAQKTLCVVENIVDCLAIEKSGQYFGLFYILGGVLNPLLGIGPDELKLDGLFERIVKNEIEEVLLAITPSVEGDITCSYIRELVPISTKVKRLGLGIPVGGNLEYLDSLTISKAIENRTTF